MNGATLNGHRVTSARATIPAWGAWYADVAVDGDHPLAGSVTLKVSDLTLVGSVIAGSAAQGRSNFRIVGGAGGWGKPLSPKSYANDAGVKHATILQDAAREVGETLGTVSTQDRVGPAYVRQTQENGRPVPASRVLQQLAYNRWYIDEAGVTHIGARPAGALVGKVTRVEPVDQARGRVVLAAEQIATILPGVVIDGFTAVDVQHDITPETGIRSTAWFAQAPSAIDAFRAILDQADPWRAYRGVTEYRVVTLTGNRLNLQPVRVSTGMPSLERVPVRPGVAGCSVEAMLGARVLVAFVNADPARPCVVGWEETDGDGFQPEMLSLKAGGSAGGERVMTTEATALLIYNTLVALMAAAGGGPLIAAVLQPLLGAAVLTALTTQGGFVAPPTSAAQVLAALPFASGFTAGVTPTPAIFPQWVSALGTGDAKTANESGLFPGLGCKAVEAG